MLVPIVMRKQLLGSVSSSGLPGASTISQFAFYIGLFLITSCMLMLQVIQTRILSVVTWYHLAFFSISMGMFGLTAGAVWVYVHRDRFTDQTFSFDLAHYSAAFAITTGLCFMIQMTLAPVVWYSINSVWTWIELALCLAIPFVFSGIVVSIALTRSRLPIGRVYAIDLAGAAAGCLAVLFLLDHTDAPSAILWVSCIAAAGALCFASSGIGTTPRILPSFHTMFRHRITIFTLLLLCAIFNGLSDYGFQPLVVKGRFEGPQNPLFLEWNSLSRIAVYPMDPTTPDLWGPSPRFSMDGLNIEQRRLHIDGDASTVALRFTGNLKDVEFLKYDVANLVYHLPDRQRAAVIGVGGGRDILSAAVFGYRDITGVEENPILLKLLTQEPNFANFTNMAKLEGVTFVQDEARSWFLHTDETYDVIQMTPNDTWMAAIAGSHSLSENSLYTVEAWKIFLNRLNPQGLFSVSSWFTQEHPEETARMLSLAVAALLDLGISEPERHIFLATSGRIATLLIARQPFSPRDLTALNKTISRYRYGMFVHPSAESSFGLFEAIVTAKGRDELNDYTSNQEFDLTPATDNRPFFFNHLPLYKPVEALSVAKNLFNHGAQVGGIRYGNLIAMVTLLVLFMVAMTLVLLTIVMPLRGAIKKAGKKLIGGGTVYFLLLGTGFMVVEIGLLQWMSLFLGQTVSLSVVLCTLILSNGIGSFLSDKWLLDRDWKFTTWALMTGGYLIALPYWLPDLLLAFSSQSLSHRVILCMATIAPAGILMGFGFPTGMRLVSAIDRTPTPWFWGISGAASVLASIVAVSTSLAFGISTTLTMGAICYFLLLPVVLTPAWTPVLEHMH